MQHVVEPLAYLWLMTNLPFNTEAPRRWTVADVLELPATFARRELLSGRLAVNRTPPASHEAVVHFFIEQFARYLAALGAQHTLFFHPADLSWDDRNLVQPDLFVVAAEEAGKTSMEVKHVSLIVEVVARTTRGRDYQIKRRLYRKHRVATYWIVDPRRAAVEIWHPGDERPEIITDTLAWSPTPDAPPLRIDIGDAIRRSHQAGRRRSGNPPPPVGR
jgi:Uma2 family endonuclease